MPNQQILPAIDWLLSPDGGSKKKIFLLGSDYVFPRTANYIAKKYLASKDLRPAGASAATTPQCGRRAAASARATRRQRSGACARECRC